jgi:pimeloyl-ACP methyl ester carboxylesterase
VRKLIVVLAAASVTAAGTALALPAVAATAKNGRLLAHMTTIDAARDMDSIRAALGQKQITYYGFSYGTYLGQVYSTLFPSHVRRLVMDSNVDPATYAWTIRSPTTWRSDSSPRAGQVAVRTWCANRSRYRCPLRPVPPRTPRAGRRPGSFP